MGVHLEGYKQIDGSMCKVTVDVDLRTGKGTGCVVALEDSSGFANME